MRGMTRAEALEIYTAAGGLIDAGYYTANVRTLALVEVLFAQGVTHFMFKQPTTTRESIGIVMVVVGVALLVWAY